MQGITTWKRLLTIPIVTFLFALATPFAIVGAAGKPSPGSNSSCPKADDLKDFVAANNVSAIFSNVGDVTTYKFISLVNEDPKSGVPGLIKYCVYPDPFAQPTAIDPEAMVGNYDWTYGSDSSDFMFVRPSGNKSNIPLDGKPTEMGTASWSTLPTDQIILLHIADAGVCSALYPGNTSGTCFVKPNLATVCDKGDTTVAYNALSFGAVNCLRFALGFEAQQTNEFGDEAGLADNDPPKELKSLNVVFASFACNKSGNWSTGNCVTDLLPGGQLPTFQVKITAKIYPGDTCHTVGCTPSGVALATATQTFNIPYRPTHDDAKCTGADLGKWWNPLGNGGVGKCQNAIAIVLEFTNWEFTTSDHTLPDNVIWTVAFNTTHYGYNPVGTSAACFTAPAGCPYDSLNVGNTSFTGAVYAGTDVDEDVAFRSWVGSGGLLKSELGWTDLRPLGEIITK